MDNLEFKSVSGQSGSVVDDAKGIVECFVAAIGNKDSVGDVVASGAFDGSLKRRRPRVVWGHDWNQPIGKVLEIYEVGPGDPRLPLKMKLAGVGGVFAKVQFNLMSERGREAFASVQFFGEDQEWSIGYKTLDSIYDPTRQANVLKEVELYEVSPVLHGANQLTATISIKSAEQDDRVTSFRKSKWDTFDFAWAKKLKEEHPDIWAKGGNTKGNAQWEILSKILEQGGGAKTDDQIAALELREAWIARHEGDFRLPGVIAQIKWLAVGKQGESKMKQVVNDAIDRKKKGEDWVDLLDELDDLELKVAEEIVEVKAEGDACPIATQDITVNLKNRQKAIDDAGYGPLNPRKPNDGFWAKKADRWDVSPDEARQQTCGNCAAFIRTSKMLNCIDKGLGNEEGNDAWDVINTAELGYCEALDFKCAASRTCDAWIVGGPITDKKGEAAQTGEYDEPDTEEDDTDEYEDSAAEDFATTYKGMLARALAMQHGRSVRVREYDKNQVIYDVADDDNTEQMTFRVSYHFDGDEFMFGDRERVEAETVYLDYEGKAAALQSVSDDDAPQFDSEIAGKGLSSIGDGIKKAGKRVPKPEAPNPDAIDKDNDGMVQDGTTAERPVAVDKATEAVGKVTDAIKATDVPDGWDKDHKTRRVGQFNETLTKLFNEPGEPKKFSTNSSRGLGGSLFMSPDKRRVTMAYHDDETGRVHTVDLRRDGKNLDKPSPGVFRTVDDFKKDFGDDYHSAYVGSGADETVLDLYGDRTLSPDGDNSKVKKITSVIAGSKSKPVAKDKISEEYAKYDLPALTGMLDQGSDRRFDRERAEELDGVIDRLRADLKKEGVDVPDDAINIADMKELQYSTPIGDDANRATMLSNFLSQAVVAQSRYGGGIKYQNDGGKNRPKADIDADNAVIDGVLQAAADLGDKKPLKWDETTDVLKAVGLPNTVDVNEARRLNSETAPAAINDLDDAIGKLLTHIKDTSGQDLTKFVGDDATLAKFGEKYPNLTSARSELQVYLSHLGRLANARSVATSMSKYEPSGKKSESGTTMKYKAAPGADKLNAMVGALGDRLPNPSNAAPDVLPQERVTGDVLRGYGPRRGNLERLLRYWRPIMRREGGFRRCRVILADHPELYPLNNICAWLHHETTGLWPNEGCHHPGMKNCRRKLKNVVNGSIWNDDQWNNRLESRFGKKKDAWMDDEDIDLETAQKALKYFLDNEPEFVTWLADEGNWVHEGQDEEDGSWWPHRWHKPEGHDCGCGCGGKGDCGDEIKGAAPRKTVRSRKEREELLLGKSMSLGAESDGLIGALKHALADVISFSFRVQGHHWNVEGPDFAQYHALFAAIYDDVADSIDPLAENVRKVGGYSPFRLSELAAMTDIPDAPITSDAYQMARDLLDTNAIVLSALVAAFAAAEAAGEQGIMDFLAGRIDMHQKWRWQLRASVGMPDMVKDAWDDIEEKALGRRGGGLGKLGRLGRGLTGRPDMNAIDADGDGLVQDSTPFERPAVNRELPGTRLAGRFTGTRSRDMHEANIAKMMENISKGKFVRDPRSENYLMGKDRAKYLAAWNDHDGKDFGLSGKKYERLLESGTTKEWNKPMANAFESWFGEKFDPKNPKHTDMLREDLLETFQDREPERISEEFYDTEAPEGNYYLRAAEVMGIPEADIIRYTDSRYGLQGEFVPPKDMAGQELFDFWAEVHRQKMQETRQNQKRVWANMDASAAMRKSAEEVQVVSEIGDILVKAGRVLSQRNMDRLQQALDLLRSIVADADTMVQVKAADAAANDYLIIDTTPEDMFALKTLVDPVADRYGAEVVIDDLNGDWLAVKADARDLAGELAALVGGNDEIQVKGFSYGTVDFQCGSCND